MCPRPLSGTKHCGDTTITHIHKRITQKNTGTNFMKLWDIVPNNIRVIKVHQQHNITFSCFGLGNPLKCRFYQRFYSMLGTANLGVQQINRGADARTLDDLLTFMSNAILKSGKDIFGMQKPLKFNVPRWNERAKEFNVLYRQAVSHWNIAGRKRSGPLAELKCRARAAFLHEMKFFRENEDQLHSQSMISKL